MWSTSRILSTCTDLRTAFPGLRKANSTLILWQRSDEDDPEQREPRLGGPERLRVSFVFDDGEKVPRDLPVSYGSVWTDPCPLHLVAERTCDDAREVHTRHVRKLPTHFVRSLTCPTDWPQRRAVHFKSEDLLPTLPRGLCAKAEAP